jgi:hypothetical protein
MIAPTDARIAFETRLPEIERGSSGIPGCYEEAD